MVEDTDAETQEISADESTAVETNVQNQNKNPPSECTPALREKMVACKRLQDSPDEGNQESGNSEACKKVYAVCDIT